MDSEKIGSATFERWTPEEVATALEAREIVLIDVRTPQEFGLERIEGALNFPMAYFDATALPPQQGRRLVLHCGSGLRSECMGKIAIEAGFDVIAHLEGGFQAWKDAKKPYIGTDFASGEPKRMNAGN